MKILHVINNLGSGGAEKLIEEAVPLMNKTSGVKVEVLLLTDEKNVFDKKLKENAVKVDVVPLKKIYSPRNIFYIRKYIASGNYDIVHVHLFPAQYWVSLASKLIFKNKPKYITTEHSTHNRRREKFYFKYVDMFIYSNYDKIISISQKAHENLILWLKPKQKDLDKFTIVENGIDITKYIEAQPYEKSEVCRQLTKNIKVICMVGRFSQQKDQPTLIKAMKKLPKNVHLLLVGEGPLKQKNEALAKKIGIEHRVHFLGFRNDVERILKTSDVVVLSSKWEGLSLSSIEGMASGKPFVASRVEGLKEIVGEYGLLFEQGNSEELSQVLEKLVNESKFSQDISARCLKRAKEFDIKIMTQTVLNLYKKLLSKM